MKRFAEFILEMEHDQVDYKEWGIIHPSSGEIIPGDSHPSAKNHKELARLHASRKQGVTPRHFAHYGLVDDGSRNQYLAIKNVSQRNHEAVLKAYNKLPHHYNKQVMTDIGKTYAQGDKRRIYQQIKNHFAKHGTTKPN